MTVIAAQPVSDVIVDGGVVIDDALEGMLVLAGMFVGVVLLLITPFVLHGVFVTRPWLTPGSLMDRLRIAWTVYRYEFWLGIADVPGRRRRDLRRELHANLAEAAARTGSREAVDALGSLRTLATSSTSTSAPRQPTWNAGQAAGVVVFAVLLVAQMLLAAGFIAGAEASGVSHTVRGAVGLPGYTVEYVQDPSGGVAFGVEGGPSIVVLPLIAFVVAARPWRLIRTRGRVVNSG